MTWIPRTERLFPAQAEASCRLHRESRRPGPADHERLASLRAAWRAGTLSIDATVIADAILRAAVR